MTTETENNTGGTQDTASPFDAIRGLLELLDSGDFVRNTEGDADIATYVRQGSRIMLALKNAQNALLADTARKEKA